MIFYFSFGLTPKLLANVISLRQGTGARFGGEALFVRV